MVQLLCESSKGCGTAKLLASLSENRQLDMAKHKLVDHVLGIWQNFQSLLRIRSMKNICNGNHQK